MWMIGGKAGEARRANVACACGQRGRMLGARAGTSVHFPLLLLFLREREESRRELFPIDRAAPVRVRDAKHLFDLGRSFFELEVLAQCYQLFQFDRARAVRIRVFECLFHFGCIAMDIAELLLRIL